MTEYERLRSEARAEVLKALAHPSRIFIVEKLQEKPHCVCELTAMIGADTSTVSKHLAILKNAGVVSDRKQGTTVYYSLACDCFLDLMDGIEQVVRNRLARHERALEGMAHTAQT